jgi:hypothetical protein
MPECQELLWRIVRIYYNRMSGVIMAKCQELWRNVRSYGGMSGDTMAECQELWRNVRIYYGGISGLIMA